MKNFNPTINHSVNFPDEININEHRAPTDESVRLLGEMEEKSQERFICKISDNRPNSFHIEAFIFQQVANLSAVCNKSVMYIKFTCNKKTYSRKVTLNELVDFYSNEQ